MANTKLADIAVGSIVKIKENGMLTDFYFAKRDYESELNGEGRILLVRKDCYDTRQWDGSNVNAYASSTIDDWLNSAYKSMLDTDVQGVLGTTEFYYTPGDGNTTVTTLQRAVFLLSLTELGIEKREGSALPIASALRIAYKDGSAVTQWTRSPNQITSNRAYKLDTDGNASGVVCTELHGSRPVFTVPSNLYVTEEGELTTSAGGREMLIPSEKLEAGAEYGIRMFPRNKRGQFQSGIGGSRLKILNQVGETAAPDDSVPEDIIPSYTGNSQIFGDGQKGYIECYSSGVLSFNTDATVDIFLVGGGGSGAGAGRYLSDDSMVAGGGGGGGGYTKTIFSIPVKTSIEYPVTIGSGGGAPGAKTNGNSGGATSFDTTYSAAGGGGGEYYNQLLTRDAINRAKGGNGGSGGGGGGSWNSLSPYGSGGAGGSGGSDGSVGVGYDHAVLTNNGTGQISNTYEFQDTTKRLFAGGGGGGGGTGRSHAPGGAGGAGGGGAGGRGAYYSGGGEESAGNPGTAGTAGTGGGGGGAGWNSGGGGGSGIAIIRWGDWSSGGENTGGDSQ